MDSARRRIWYSSNSQKSLIKLERKSMALDPELVTALQELSNRFKVKLVGAATPVAPVGDGFDVEPNS